MSDTIEFLDTDDGAAGAEELVRSRGGRAWLPMVALLAVLGLGTVVLLPDDAEPEPEPEVTVPVPSTTTTEPPITTVPGDALPVRSGVELGEPVLEWQAIEWTFGTDRFEWADDRFVGADTETEWSIRPGVRAPSVAQRPSPYVLVDDSYRAIDADGAWVLAPDVLRPDHVLIIETIEPERIELTAEIVPPAPADADDLVRFVVDVRAAVTPDRVLLVVDDTPVVNRQAIAAALDLGEQPAWVEITDDGFVTFGPGGPDPVVPFDDPRLGADDGALVAGLARPRTTVWEIDRATGSAEVLTTADTAIALGLTADEVVLVTATGVESGGATTIWRSNRDGNGGDTEWRVEQPASFTWWDVDVAPTGLVANGGDRVGLIGDGRFADLPFVQAEPGLAFGQLATNGDVVLSTTSSTPDDAALRLPGPRHDVEVGSDTPEFVVTDRVTGAVVAEGTFDLPGVDGVINTPTAIRFLDPSNGAVLSTVTFDDLRAAITRSISSTPGQVMAEARLDDDVPTWSVRRVQEVFGVDARSVQFASGDGVVLAAVRTDDDRIRLFLGTP